MTDINAALRIALPLIMEREGFRDEPYLDSAGIPTVGYGSIEYANGRPVALGDRRLPEPAARDLLAIDVRRKVEAIAALLFVPASNNQFAAMVSLTYNIGVAGFRASSVRRYFNSGNLKAAADAFLLWDKATVNGRRVTVPGLAARRVAERALFLKA